MVPSAPVSPEVSETPVVTAPVAEVAAAPVAAPVAAEAGVPSVEVAVTAQAEVAECLITTADAVGPEAIALVGFALIGIIVKLFQSRPKKA